MNTFYLLTFGFVLASIPLAVGQTDMQWDSYGLGFTLERGMRITTNDGEEFTAERQELFITIHPLTNEYVTEDDLIDAVIMMAKDMEYDDISDADVLELDDLIGVYIEGKTEGTSSFVIALMDTESAQNYIVIVLFEDNFRDEAIDMILSFYPYDEP